MKLQTVELEEMAGQQPGLRKVLAELGLEDGRLAEIEFELFVGLAEGRLPRDPGAHTLAIAAREGARGGEEGT